MVERKFTGVVAIAAVVAVGASVASGQPVQGNSIPPGPITIGLAIARTGPIVPYDSMTYAGAQIAAADINAKGGVLGHPIRLITANTNSDIAQSANAGLEVIGKGAQFLITTVDYNYGGGAARVGQERGRVVISSAGDLRYGKAIGRLVFNLYVGARTEGATMAEFAYRRLGWRRAYSLADVSLSSNAQYCVMFQRAFKALGGTIVSKDTFQESAQSIPSQVTRLNQTASRIDGLAFCANPPGGASALRQIRGSGFNKAIVTTSGFGGNFWQEGVPDLSKLYAVSLAPATPGQNPTKLGNRIVAKAMKTTGKPVTVGFALMTAYSAVQAIAKAATAVKSVSGPTVARYLETFRDVRLAIGPTTWTKACHARAGGPMVIVNFANKVETYQTTIRATKIPRPICGV